MQKLGGPTSRCKGVATAQGVRCVDSESGTAMFQRARLSRKTEGSGSSEEVRTRNATGRLESHGKGLHQAHFDPFRALPDFSCYSTSEAFGSLRRMRSLGVHESLRLESHSGLVEAAVCTITMQVPCQITTTRAKKTREPFHAWSSRPSVECDEELRSCHLNSCARPKSMVCKLRLIIEAA